MKEAKPIILGYAEPAAPKDWPDWKRWLLLLGCLVGLAIGIVVVVLVVAMICADVSVGAGGD